MNTILFYTIVVIVILIVCFFLSKRMYNTNNLKGDNTISLESFTDFTTKESNFDSDLNTFFNLTDPAQLYGESNLEDLKNKSLQAKSHIEPNDKFSCHTKYTHIYNLFVLNENQGHGLKNWLTTPHGGSEIRSTLIPIEETETSLNDCLMKASYGPLTLKDGTPIPNNSTGQGYTAPGANYTPDDIEGVLFEANDDGTTKSYYILKSNLRSSSVRFNHSSSVLIQGVHSRIGSQSNKGKLHVVKKNKFTNDPAFIDFGVKGKINIYAKKFRYNLPGTFTYYYESQNTFIFNEGYNYMRNISNLNTRVNAFRSRLLQTVYGDRSFLDTQLNNNSITNIRRKETAIINYETLFNRLISNDLKPGGDNNPIISEENRRQLFLDSLFIDTVVPNNTHPKRISGNITYVIIVLIRLRTHIIKDNFLEKFNCKYFTYLFYSFNDGWNIFRKYIESVLTPSDIKVMKKFFEIYQFERLYKCFIASLSDKCNSIAEHSIDDEHEGIDVNSCRNLFIFNNSTEQQELKQKFKLTNDYCPRNAGTIVFKNDINLHKYFFYSNLNYDGMVLGCSKISEEDKCTPELTFNQCSWNTNNNKCEVDNNFNFEKCIDYNSYTNDDDIKEECDKNNSCEFNPTNKKCYPKPCLDKNTTTQQLQCATHNHCKNYPEYRIEDGEYKSNCYDNERVMYSTKSEDGAKLDSDNSDSPQNFFTKVNTHLSDCTDGSEIGKSLSATCKNTAITSCKILDKDQPRFNPSKFETCVSEELIDKNNFYNCFNKKSKESCDNAYGENISCFWQDGKCYKRDAPLEWISRDSPDYGLEDMTDCKNFISEFECPIDRCIWHEDKCKRKNEHPYFPTGAVGDTEEQDTPNITVPLDRENVDCLAINNQANNTIDEARNECLHNKCHWDTGKSLCMNNIDRFCELHKTKEKCLDLNGNGLANFDPVSHQNKCSWVDDKSNTFSNTDGFCIDTRMKQPCVLFDSLSCPIEDKVDNMGNVIRGSAHCKLNDSEECVNKDSNFIDEYNSCQYNYINNGGSADETFCQLNDLYSSNQPSSGATRTSDLIKKMTPRQLLPCSALSTTEADIRGCHNENITNGKCFIEGGKCTYPKTMNDIETIVNDISNPNDASYQKIVNTRDKLLDMKDITNDNKQYYIKERGNISGLIIDVINDPLGNQHLKLDTDRISNITVNDIIIIKDSSGNELFKVSVESVNVVTQEVQIKNIDQSNLIPSTIGDNGETWTLEDPNIGLFGSYQQAQAMIDSKKINDFYNNFL